MTKKARDKRLLVARKMPPLYRTHPGEVYSRKRDSVLKWISAQPGLLLYVLDKLTQNGSLLYDRATGKWRGADYDAAEKRELEVYPCDNCGCWDADLGCTMPSVDKIYACPLEDYRDDC